IRMAVLLTSNMVKRYRFEAVTEFLGLFVQRLQILVLDLVDALHLFDQQFTVAIDDESWLAKFCSPLQRPDQRRILGDIIRLLPQATFVLVNDFAVLVDHERKGSGAGIATRRAVDVNVDGSGAHDSLKVSACASHIEPSLPIYHCPATQANCRLSW